MYSDDMAIGCRRAKWSILAGVISFILMLALSGLIGICNANVAQAANAGSAARTGGAGNVVTAPITPIAPTIDGMALEPMWTQADVHPLMTASGSQVSESKTTFRLSADNEWLYLFIEAEDAKAAQLNRENAGRDRIAWDETIEVLIAPDAESTRYLHFAVAPGGSDHDGIERAPGMDMDFSWQHAQVITNRGWQVEIAIPLKEIGLNADVVSGDRMEMNVVRHTQHAVHERNKKQSWSPTGDSFHNRMAFGTVVVGSLADAASRTVDHLRSQWTGAQLRIKTDEQAAALSHIPQAIAAIEGNVSTMKTAQQWLASERQAAQLLADMVQVLASDPLMLWQVNPWDLPGMDALPSIDQARLDVIQAEAFQGEYVTAAFAMANLSNDAVRLRVMPRGLARVGGSDVINVDDHITVRRVTEIPVQGGALVRDALPQLRMEDEITLLPKTNAVIWLTLRTHDLPSGQWRSNLAIIPVLSPDDRKLLPVELKVLPARLPQEMKPLSANWATYERLPSARNLDASIKDQLAHDTSIHFLPGYASSGIAALQFDEQMKPLNEPDFSLLDQWLDRIDTPNQFYVLNVNYSHLPKELGGKENYENPQAVANFGWWVKQVRKHFESRGISVRDFAWYAADEPDLERVGWVQKFGKMMHQSDREQQIFVTVYQAQGVEWLQMMGPYVNVWAAKHNIFPPQREFIRSQKARFFSYTVLPIGASPYSIYRREAMVARVMGSESIGFWSYDDAGHSSENTTWIPNPNRPRYAVVYEGQHDIVPSVRWEAWRQGIQDSAYLQWLETLAGSSTDGTLAGKAAAQAKDIPGQIINNSDRGTSDRLMADARQSIVGLLVADGEMSTDQLDYINRPSPVCLTGNDIINQYENVPFTGKYAYSHPALEEIDNTRRLTDGNVQYSKGWVIWSSAARSCHIIFDLNAQAALSHVDLLVDPFPFVPGARGYAISVSETGADGSWESVDSVELVHRPGDSELSADDGRRIDLGTMTMALDGRKARYVRVEATTTGALRIGEVRIYGWPEN